MGAPVYILCASLSIICAAMLFRGYAKNRTQLLLWSSLCFVFLAINNSVLFVDMIVLPDVDIGGQLWRNLIKASAGALLLFGLLRDVT